VNRWVPGSGTVWWGEAIDEPAREDARPTENGKPYHERKPAEIDFALDKHCSIRHNTAMLSKELVAASTVPLVLSVLTEGESYGYELIQRVRALSGGRIEWTEGMLYPVLHWMEKEELIESEWREAETGRKRKYYRLRKEGRKALQEEKQQWMTVHATLAKLWITLPSST
jgi:DNA-binding MarR family transcriptional regulator